MAVVVPVGPRDIQHIVPDVYTRDEWANPWVKQDFLYCRSLQIPSLTGQGSISSGSFHYDYGRLSRGQETDATHRPALELLDHWIKVEWLNHSTDYDVAVADQTERLALMGLQNGDKVLQKDDKHIYNLDDEMNPGSPGSWTDEGEAEAYNFGSWYGVVTNETRSENERYDTVNEAAGTQTIAANGVEWLLAKHQIVESVIQDDPGIPDSVFRVPEAIAFNDYTAKKRTPVQRLGNQANIASTITLPGGILQKSVQVFDKTMNNPRMWNAKEIIDYLLCFFTHYGEVGQPSETPIIWTLELPTDNVLGWYEPRKFEVHGSTVFEAISGLVNRKRGLVWWVEVDEDNDEFKVKADTMIAGAGGRTLPGSGLNLPQNSTIVSLDFVDSPSANQFSHVIGTSRRRNNQTVTGSVEVQAARRGVVMPLTINAQLLPAWEAADEAAYATADDATRMSDEDLQRVYTHFILDPDWDGTPLATLSRSGSQGDDTAGAPPFWRSGIRFENYLPIKANHSYDGLGGETNNLPQNLMPTFFKPTAVIEVETGMWKNVQNLYDRANAEGSNTSGIKFNCSVRMMKDQPGVVIDPTSGPNHLLGLNHFGAVNTDFRPKLDYTKLEVMVYMTLSERIRVFDPFDETQYPTNERFDHYLINVIRLGDRLHVDQWQPSTHAEHGLPTGPGGYLRDDRREMRDLATMAYDDWYGSTRDELTINLGMINQQLMLGNLIVEDWDGNAMNSIVSQLNHDFFASTTTIITKFPDIDLSEFIT